MDVKAIVYHGEMSKVEVPRLAVFDQGIPLPLAPWSHIGEALARQVAAEFRQEGSEPAVVKGKPAMRKIVKEPFQVVSISLTEAKAAAEHYGLAVPEGLIAGGGK